MTRPRDPSLDSLLAHRYSCRAFLTDEVPEQTVREVFDLAQRTASWCNTQPWQVIATRGGATRKLATGLLTHVAGAQPTGDLDLPSGYSGVYDERRRTSGYAPYASLGIERHDMPARAQQMMRNFDFFGAPHVAVVTTDREQGTYGAIDCGGYVGNLLLALRSRDIDSIAQAAIATYSDAVHELLAIPDDRLVVCAVAFGYADRDHPANGFRTDRAHLDDAVTFLG